MSIINGRNKDIIAGIEKLFDTSFKSAENSIILDIKNEQTNFRIHLEMFTDNSANTNDEDNYLISVYTNNCHLQLQNCKRIIISQMLEEIIFISETETKLSGLIVSRKGDCALYSNVNKDILSKDFAELNSEKLLSAVALSVSEEIPE
ncbi:MAG TPA: hypothetical protein VHP32_07965 [Ignavibacteria bacterium]|nr:hypothetical protein [Ignavibacteria bacterium]